MVGFRGLTASPGTLIHRQIRELDLAGVVLFDEDASTLQQGRNIVRAAQTRELTTQLQAASRQHLLIAIDQEGGQVARLNPSNGFPQFPSHAEMGEKFEPGETRLTASRMGKMLADVGINVNFAPVVDLNLNPQNPIIGALGRSFSDQPDIVTDHARAFIAGHHEHGIATAIKHFPGHGSSFADSHRTAVHITETFDDRELIPYRRLIVEGIIEVVMVGHLLHGGYDPELPASLSSNVINGLLRRELGFDGVVVSDDLDMAAVAHPYSLHERVALALNAGVDLLLFGNNVSYHPNRPTEVLEAIIAAVAAGDVSEDCLRRHAQRVDRLRARLSGKSTPPQ